MSEESLENVEEMDDDGDLVDDTSIEVY